MIKPIEFLIHYRNHKDFYLPMIDHERQTFEPRDEYDTVNIGWDCGTIGKRPYFLECWAADGITMETFFISTRGMESLDDKSVVSMLFLGGLIGAPTEMDKIRIKTFVDGSGEEFWSINIVVGTEYMTYDFANATIYSYEELNNLNR